MSVFKVGDKVICKFIQSGEWKEIEAIVENIDSEYITVRISGTLGGTLHMICPECVRYEDG